MSDTDVSWRWDFVVFRLCNQNPTLSQRQIDVNPIFIFNQNATSYCLTSCPTSIWRYIDVWCLLGWLPAVRPVCDVIFSELWSPIQLEWVQKKRPQQQQAAQRGAEIQSLSLWTALQSDTDLWSLSSLFSSFSPANDRVTLEVKLLLNLSGLKP